MKKEIISIVVLSYNSEDTVLETLNSILNQDYGSQYIELIIGDDASKDSTQKIINKWLIEHKNNFYSTIFNIHLQNQGVVANFNSICKLATSNWVKPIAADDILMNNCISEFNKFVTEHNNNQISCIFCKVQEFNSNRMLEIFPRSNYYFNLSSLKQLKSLLIDNFIPAPGSFIKRSLLIDIHLPDEKLSLEDYPLWLKFTSMGIQLKFIDKVLVHYRIGESISNSNQRLINIKLNNDVYKCKKIYLSYLDFNLLHKLLYYFDILISRMCDLISIHLFKNKKNKLSYKITIRLRVLSPIYLLSKLKFYIKTNQPSNK